jgi:threonine dehydratase
VLTLSDIETARRRIASHIRQTPVMDIDGVVCKLEFTQHSGSFKARGAFNRILSAPAIPRAGVITASGGNHGAAVAFAASALGIATEVFVPEVTAASKIDRIRGYGASVVIGGARYDDARAACEARAAETGAMLIHAFDQFDVVAGQGTVGLELAGQAPDLDVVLVAVGGGGLIGGIAAAYAERGVRVVGVEPVGMPTLHAALAAGRPVDVTVDGLAADSLGAKRIGTLSFEICAANGVDSVLVSDADITEARRHLWESARILTEPGGAAALAALRGGAFLPGPHERIGVILCGANTGALP